jgi:hypothetical protein
MDMNSLFGSLFENLFDFKECNKNLYPQCCITHSGQYQQDEMNRQIKQLNSELNSELNSKLNKSPMIIEGEFEDITDKCLLPNKALLKNEAT